MAQSLKRKLTERVFRWLSYATCFLNQVRSTQTVKGNRHLHSLAPYRCSRIPSRPGCQCKSRTVFRSLGPPRSRTHKRKTRPVRTTSRPPGLPRDALQLHSVRCRRRSDPKQQLARHTKALAYPQLLGVPASRRIPLPDFLEAYHQVSLPTSSRGQHVPQVACRLASTTTTPAQTPHLTRVKTSDTRTINVGEHCNTAAIGCPLQSRLFTKRPIAPSGNQ